MRFDWSQLGPLLAVIHLLGLAAACHAIMNTRTSQGAIAWAVSLATMPYLTLIPYLFLGRSKFEGYVDARRLRNENLRERAHAPERDKPRHDGASPDHEPGTRMIRTMAHLGGLPLAPGNSVRTLVNGEATFGAIFDAIEQAKHYVIVAHGPKSST